MKKLALLISICFMMLSFINVKAQAQQWKAANEAYKNQDYEEAIQAYESMLKKNNVAAEVYYNLGNAYYQIGNKPKATVNYLKALEINPGLKSAKDNISFIQSLQKGPKSNMYNSSWIHTLSPNIWAWLALLFVLITYAIFYFKKLKPKKLFKPVLLSAGATSLILLLVAYFSYAEAQKAKAVVLENNTFIYNNSSKNKVTRSLPEAEIVYILNWQNEMAEVRLSNGEKGWVSTLFIEKI